MSAARRDSDAWYRSLIENSSDAVLVLDAGGMIRYGTPSIKPALGMEAKKWDMGGAGGVARLL